MKNNIDHDRADKYRRSLARRFILYILLFSSVITLLSTSYQLYLDYSHDVNTIQKNMRQIELSYLNSIVNSLWVIDNDSLKIQVDGILQMPDMQSVEIKSNNKQIFFAGDVKNSNVIRKEFKLFFYYKGQNISIGTLTVVANLGKVYQRLMGRVVFVLFTQAIKTFLVSFFIFFLFYYLLGRHLNIIANYVAEFNLNNLDDHLTLIRRKINHRTRDELDLLVSGINRMQDNLAQDIKARENTETLLKESEEKFRTLVTNAEEIVYMIAKDGTFILSEGKGLSKLGLKAGEVVGQSVFDLYKGHPEMLSKMRRALNDETVTFEVNNIMGNDFRNWYTPQKNNDGETVGLFGLSVNITEQKEAERKINSSLKEKETLLQEIHHRVKNNMQVISSLLKLQANNIEDNQIKEVLKDSQSRVYAMSAVHETLHGSDKLSRIDLKTYLSKITSSIFQSYAVSPTQLKLKNEIEEIVIDINQASPLGLIINELISNALKYAFPKGRRGEVYVSMNKLGEVFELIVMDDGVGMPVGLDWKNSKTLGLKLVRTLVENQLDGSIEMESNHGTKFTIKFKTENAS